MEPRAIEKQPIANHSRIQAGLRIDIPKICIALPNGLIASTPKNARHFTISDPRTGECLKIINTAYEIQQLSFLQNDCILVTSKDAKPQIFNIKTGKEIFLKNRCNIRGGLKHLSGSRYIDSTDKGEWIVFDFQDLQSKLIPSTQHETQNMTVLSPSCFISFLKKGDRVLIWNGNKFKLEKEARLSAKLLVDDQIYVSALPEQHFLLSVWGKPNLQLYKINEKFDLHLVAEIPMKEKVYYHSALPDGQHFIFYDSNGDVQLWNWRERKCVDACHIGDIASPLLVCPTTGAVSYILTNMEMGVITYACVEQARFEFKQDVNFSDEYKRNANRHYARLFGQDEKEEDLHSVKNSHEPCCVVL